MSEIEKRQKVVSEYYTQLECTDDIKSNVCVASPLPPQFQYLYDKIPKDVKDKFYGCGAPIPSLLSGCRVLDLGCGAGRDTFMVSALVGPTGEAVGIDMTDAMLSVARENTHKWKEAFTDFEPNVRFIKGVIEDLKGVEDSSIDVCVSNCVVNLSADKAAVLKAVQRVLKKNGEFYFSDIYADRRLTTDVTQDRVLIGECVGGAEYYRDFLCLCKKLGFNDPRIISTTRISLEPEIDALVHGAKIYSITMRLFKNDKLEQSRENYGDVAVYMGGAELPEKIEFDDTLIFEKNNPTKIDGNVATIFSESERFKKYMRVRHTDPRVHLGTFMSDNLDVKLAESPIRTGCCDGNSKCCQ